MDEFLMIRILTILLLTCNLAIAQISQSTITNDITNNLPTNNQNLISADLLRNTLNAMTSAIFQSQGLNGLTISGTPSVGQALIATGSTTANWQNIGGIVTNVSNSDGSLTVSPTTGLVIASINTAHNNVWGSQTFTGFDIKTATLTGGLSGGTIYAETVTLGGTSGLGNTNTWTISSDTQQCAFCTNLYSIWNYGGATAKGARANYFGWNIQTAPNTGSGTTAGIGGGFIGQTNTGESGGTWFGINPIVRVTGNGLNAFASENDYQTTSSWTGSYGAAVTATNFAAHQASVVDAGFLIYSGGLINAAGGGGPWGPGIGFHCGLCFAELSSNTLVPIDSAGTLIGSVWTSISAPTVALGVDFGNGTSTGFNFSTGAFRSKGFLVDGSGNTTIFGATHRKALDVGPDTGTNGIQINGGGSGGSAGPFLAFAGGGTTFATIGFPSALFGGSFDNSLGFSGFTGIKAYTNNTLALSVDTSQNSTFVGNVRSNTGFNINGTAGASCTIVGATAHLTVVNGIVTLCN